MKKIIFIGLVNLIALPLLAKSGELECRASLDYASGSTRDVYNHRMDFTNQSEVSTAFLPKNTMFKYFVKTDKDGFLVSVMGVLLDKELIGKGKVFEVKGTSEASLTLILEDESKLTFGCSAN